MTRGVDLKLNQIRVLRSLGTRDKNQQRKRLLNRKGAEVG